MSNIEPTEEQYESAHDLLQHGSLRNYENDIMRLAQWVAERESPISADINAAVTVFLAAGLGLDVKSNASMRDRAIAIVAQHQRVRAMLLAGVPSRLVAELLPNGDGTSSYYVHSNEETTRVKP